QLWTVEFAGFAPGFGYLTGSEGGLEVPRRASPRTRIPAGSVGLPGASSGIYPRASPGGWQLIGRSDAPLWDADRDPPALLTPGRRVRFVEVGRWPRWSSRRSVRSPSSRTSAVLGTRPSA